MSRRIAITGASGYIGSALCKDLIDKSFDLIRVSRSTLEPLGNSELLIGDICEYDTWANIVKKTDIIFHLAGNTSAYRANNDPMKSLHDTMLPLAHLIKAAQEFNKVPKLIYASTATVYGLTPAIPINENFALKPETIYDLHKIFFEKHMNLAIQQGFMQGVSLRLSNVYGPSPKLNLSDDRGILNKATLAALHGKSLVVYGDGNYLRDYIYIDDVVEAFKTVGLSKGFSNTIYNIGTGEGVSVKNAFNLIAENAVKFTGNPIKIENAAWPNESITIDRRNYIADISNINRALGWQAKINLKT